MAVGLAFPVDCLLLACDARLQGICSECKEVKAFADVKVRATPFHAQSVSNPSCLQHSPMSNHNSPPSDTPLYLVTGGVYARQC